MEWMGLGGCQPPISILATKNLYLFGIYYCLLYHRIFVSCNRMLNPYQQTALQLSYWVYFCYQRQQNSHTFRETPIFRYKPILS